MVSCHTRGAALLCAFSRQEASRLRAFVSVHVAGRRQRRHSAAEVSPQVAHLGAEGVGLHRALLLFPPPQPRRLPVRVEPRPDRLLLLPLRLQSSTVSDRQLLGSIEAIQLDAEVAAALHEEVVLVILAVELHSPAAHRMPADALYV